MTSELSDLLNEENKYDFIALRMHKKVKHNIIPFLFLKQSMISYKFFHIIYILISSIGILILSDEFIPKEKRKYFSDYFRELTMFSLIKKLKITHSTYLIICAVIFVICAFRLIFLINFIQK